MGGIDPTLITITKDFKCKPERLTSGFLVVNVKHEDASTGELDCNYAYYKGWGDDPNNVPAGGDYPYKTTSGAAQPLYNSGSFTDGTCDTNDTAGSGTTYGANPRIIRCDSTSKIKIGMVVSGTGLTGNANVSQIDSETLFRIDEDVASDQTNTTLTFVNSWAHRFYNPLGSAESEKTLSLGDHDCFLYFVTCAAHLQANYYPIGTTTTTHETRTYYSKGLSHNACQSFIKSHLISRINNSADADHVDPAATDGSILDVKSMWKQGGRREEHTVTAVSDGADERTSEAESYLYSHGDYIYPSFGIDLGSKSDIFTPVYKVEIGIDHPNTSTATDISTTNPHTGTDIWYQDAGDHVTNAFDLRVSVYLWAFDESTDGSFFRNRVNVFWQPFGETSELQLG